MPEWQRQRTSALELADRLSALRDERDRFHQKIVAASRAVASGLRAVGFSDSKPPGADPVEELRGLIAHANHRERQATEDKATFEARIKSQRQLHNDQARVSKLIA